MSTTTTQGAAIAPETLIESAPESAGDTLIWRAIEIADRLRKEHNGIFGVRIYLGHDGDNVCHLDNYDGEIGYGCSGKSLLDAVEKAEADWRFRLLRGSRRVAELAQEACLQHGSLDGVFNTANFHQCVGHLRLSHGQVTELLATHPRIVRLFGGAHWLLLPGGHTRYEEASR